MHPRLTGPFYRYRSSRRSRTRLRPPPCPLFAPHRQPGSRPPSGMCRQVTRRTQSFGKEVPPPDPSHAREASHACCRSKRPYGKPSPLKPPHSELVRGNRARRGGGRENMGSAPPDPSHAREASHACCRSKRPYGKPSPLKPPHSELVRGNRARRGGGREKMGSGPPDPSHAREASHACCRSKRPYGKPSPLKPPHSELVRGNRARRGGGRENMGSAPPDLSHAREASHACCRSKRPYGKPSPLKPPHSELVRGNRARRGGGRENMEFSRGNRRLTPARDGTLAR